MIGFAQVRVCPHAISRPRPGNIKLTQKRAYRTGWGGKRLWGFAFSAKLSTINLYRVSSLVELSICKKNPALHVLPLGCDSLLL